MKTNSIVPLPHCINVAKSKINHYTLSIPQVVKKETIPVQENFVTNVKYLQPKSPKTGPKLKPEITEDTFTASPVSQKEKQPKKTNKNNQIKGDKPAMEEYFNSKMPIDEPVQDKNSWYKQIAKEYEEQEMKEAKEFEQYWKTYSQKRQAEESSIEDYFTNYFH